MSDPIKLPLGGTHPKNEVYIFGGLVVVVVGYALYKRKKAAAAAAATPATDPSQIDPATGFAYGSTEDANALANQTAYVSAANGNAGGGGGPAASGTTTPTGGFTSNDQWKQAADQYLTGLGLDGPTVSSALGKYLTGDYVSAEEKNLIEQAIGSENTPPVPGPNGYPPYIRLHPTTGPTPTPASPHPTATLAAPHLTSQTIDAHNAKLSWTKPSGAVNFTIERVGHGFISYGTIKMSVNVPRHSTYRVIARNPGHAVDSPPATIVVN